jgi:hypothetical protein
LLATALLEEYRQLYGLVLFRLQALDQRLALAGAGLVALLASMAVLPPPALWVLPPPALWVLLLAAPASMPWLLRSSLRHAQSFQDALDRIAAIEQAINTLARGQAMNFQSTHPSRRLRTGGRTGHETVEAIQGAAAVVLSSCLYLVGLADPIGPWAHTGYAALIGLVAGGMLVIVHRALGQQKR